MGGQIDPITGLPLESTQAPPPPFPCNHMDVNGTVNIKFRQHRSQCQSVHAEVGDCNAAHSPM